MKKLLALCICLLAVCLIAGQAAYGADMAKKELVSTPNAPKAIGPYAQAVKYGDFLFVSGMIPIEPKSGTLMDKATIEEQTTQVLENIKGVVEAAGMTLDNVLKATVYLHSMENFPKFNAVYGKYFDKVLPARETVEVSHLPRNVGVEISVICGK